MMKQKKFVKNFFDLLKNRYQNNLESMKGSDFVFDYIHLLYYKCCKINPKRGVWYIDSPDWIKKQKSISKSQQQKQINVLIHCKR